MSSISIKSGSISLLFVTFFFLPGFSQVTQPARYELLLQSGFESPQVTPLGENGVLVYRRIRDKANDLLELIRVDTAMKESWRGAIAIEKNLIISKVFARDQRVYLLMNAVYGGYDLNVLVVNVQNQNFNRIVVKNLIPLRTTEFKVTPLGLLIGGYFNNEIPVVLHFSFSTGRSRLLPGFFNDPGDLNQIKTYEDGSIDIIVSTKSIERKKVLWLRSYTAEGDLIEAKVIQDNQKNLQFGRSIRKPDGTQIVIGNFSVRNYDNSKGIFYTELNAAGENEIKYYNFSDLENFYKYMKPPREARVKERIERRKLNGRKVRYTYEFLAHELIKSGSQYLFLGEVYYPRYYYLNNLGYASRGQRVFDGYRYTHAVLMGFDESGNLIWDNSFEINDIKTFNLLQFVRMVPMEDRVGLAYLYENKIRSKTIDGDEILAGKSEMDLNLKYQSELVKEKRTESSFLDYWYDPYLIAYGIQYVSNENERDNSGRRMLFINKLKIQ